MKSPFSRNKDPDEAQQNDSSSEAPVQQQQAEPQTEPQPSQQPQEQPATETQPPREEKKKRGLFGRKPKESDKEKKRPEPEEAKQEAQAPPVVAQQPEKKKRGLFSRSKDKSGGPHAHPSELIQVEGHRVLIPTYEDIDKYGLIVYPVNEPYQYVNLHYENGELMYTNVEPQLTDWEKQILKKTGEAYDVLVNVNTVLTNTEDKAQFLDKTFQDITKIYSMRLTDLEFRRILYYVNRDYIGYGRIDTLVNDRLIEDISCNGPNSPVYVYHRFFESIRTNVVFEEVELNNFILRLAQFSGRHISILQPIRDAALPDGSRINMTLGKEVTKKGSTFTIRKFRSDPISPVEIMMLRTADSKIFAFLWILVEYGRSLLISGGTAAGKSIPYDEKVLVYRSGRLKLERIGRLYDELAQTNKARRTGEADQYEVIDCLEMETPAFGSNLKVSKFPVKSIVRHPADKSVFRIKTRTGRVVRTTGDHSIFTMANGSVAAYPVSALEAGMYVAVPRSVPESDAGRSETLDLIDLFSREDYGLYVDNVCDIAKAASDQIGQEETAKILGIQKRMLTVGIRKGFLAVRVHRLAKLAKASRVEFTPEGLYVRPKTIRRSRVPAKLPVSNSLMRFMGYWAAEGKYDHGLLLFQVDEATKADMAKAGEKAFGLPAHQHTTDPMRLEFKYSVLEALFRRVFGPGSGSAAKTIPDLVLEHNNLMLAEFLRGYFTGDGNAGRQVEATTKSADLAERLLTALSRFGIVASVRPKRVKGSLYHTVSLYGQRNLQLFEQNIGFLNKAQQEKLLKFAHREIAPHTNVDTVPGIAGLLKEALAFKHGDERRQLWSDWHSYWAPAVKTIGRETLASYVGVTGAEGEVKERLMTLAYSDLFWDEVESVEEEAYNGKYVYDFEVPGVQNFVGGSGGVFLHNTTLLNSISMLIRPENKIVSVEDTPEINLAHTNWIQAVTRVGFGEVGGSVSGISGISGVSVGGRSAGDISLYDLLIAALRQRPDFIIVGEVRGEEAYTLFQAISVGHATMGTIHAASMPELLARAESQPMNVPRVLIANLDLVIFVAAVRKGDEKVRRVREIIEILGVNPATKELITNVVFTWDPVKDTFEFTGRSFQIEKISKSTGVPIEKLDRELDNRIQLLERMKAEGIVNYKAVSELVRQYYLDPEGLLRQPILSALVSGTKTEGEVSWGGRGGDKM